MLAKKSNTSINMSNKLWKEIEKYQFQNQIKSTSAAIEKLCKSALKEKTPKELIDTHLNIILEMLTAVNKKQTELPHTVKQIETSITFIKSELIKL